MRLVVSSDEEPLSLLGIQDLAQEIIRLAVMMYGFGRFPLSLRNVEDLLHERRQYPGSR